MNTLKTHCVKITIVLSVVILAIVAGILIRDKKNELTIPTLELPVELFDRDLIRGGSSEGTDKDGNTIFSYARVDEGYRSFPTTTISLKREYYNQEINDLPPVKSDKDIYIMENNIGHDSFKEQINKNGEIARRFLPDDTITNIEQFDVDNDGRRETIISTCGLWGNGCPHDIVIVKDNKIIFRTTAGKIISSKTNNGFYLTWEKTYKDPHGYMITRFVFKEGKFVPVYEQESQYIIVADPKYKEI